MESAVATPLPAASTPTPAPSRPLPVITGPGPLRRGFLRVAGVFDAIGLNWLGSALRVIGGVDRGQELRSLLHSAGLPVLSILLATGIWHLVALNIQVGGLALPTPPMVAERAMEQWREWRAEGVRHAEYRTLVATTAAEQKLSIAEVTQLMPFEGKKLFIDQIFLSVKTALLGVGLAMLVAIPAGIICGLSGSMFAMANPLIQVFKPVSPLAWFPVVYLFVNRAVAGNDGPVAKSTLIAALVVGLCSLWPALITTANGVANVPKDYLNVARVLNLGWATRIRRIILPASLPFIFTGMRLSLGVGWMVLIAAEMMAVSPGLGGFIWDWYQSSNEIALSYLVLAVLVVGAIGFLMDRVMIGLQQTVSRGQESTIR